MRIALRCIYYKAVTPSCDIVDMDDATWKEFLHTYVKEVVWIPLEGQDKLKEI